MDHALPQLRRYSRHNFPKLLIVPVRLSDSVPSPGNLFEITNPTAVRPANNPCAEIGGNEWEPDQTSRS
jgi:hypothetical protein